MRLEYKKDISENTLFILSHYLLFCKTFFTFSEKDVKDLKIFGIICEYNPFHNGHLYQIEQTKKAGADGIVCIMSGNFVQRAECAVMKKEARAEVAIKCGADLVIELPLPYSIASAERFARGGISILNSLGTVSGLSFGAETDDANKLTSVAKLLLDSSFDSEIIKEYKKGVSFPTARYNALKKHNPELSKILKTPNNILAVEYIKALLTLKSEIVPLPILRKGAAHDTECENGDFSSASHIRELIFADKDVSHLLPDTSYEKFVEEKICGRAPNNRSEFDRAELASLKRLSASDFLKYSDVSEGLDSRLYDAVSRSAQLCDAVTLAKTKRYTHSRIRRIFLNAFLDVDSSFAEEKPPYARILAFNETGRKIVKASKKTSDIPIITRPSSIKNEDKKAQDFFALERRADDIYSLFSPSPQKQGNTLTSSPKLISVK